VDKAIDLSIIGVDQALTDTGVCLITLFPNSTTIDYFNIKPKKLKGTERLIYIRDKLRQIIMAHNTKIVMLEGYSYESKNAAQSLGELGGTIKVMTGDMGITSFVVPPKLLKKFATGTGSASKEAMMKKYDLDDDNLADARALAEIGVRILTGVTNSRIEAETVHTLKNNPGNIKIHNKKRINKKAYKQYMTIL
jgi:Holliday junction resolvasome RuvABC endonuclease subunit